MGKDDLEINRLERFTKRSSWLVLEEHGPCEVPAGCGGVILRWRNPADGPTVGLERAGQGRTALFIDGRAPDSAFVSLPYGDHLLALHLYDLPPGPIVLGLAARLATGASLSAQRPLAPLCTAADGSWRGTTQPPSDERWRDADFDDARWGALPAGTEPEGLESHQRWAYRRMEALGAQLLAVGSDVAEAWIRKRLTITPDDDAPEGDR